MSNFCSIVFKRVQGKVSNLLIAAMNGISNSFEEAIHKINDVLAVTGEVLPVTLRYCPLCKIKNGVIVKENH